MRRGTVARIQFQLVSADAAVVSGHAVVVGRCCEAEFGVGDVFTSLQGVRFGRYDDKTGVYPPIGEPTVVVVNLRVEEISCYQQRIERLGSGWTAGLRVSGEGIHALILRVERAPEFVWSLWGETGGKS